VSQSKQIHKIWNPLLSAGGVTQWLECRVFGRRTFRDLRPM